MSKHQKKSFVTLILLSVPTLGKLIKLLDRGGNQT